MQASRDPLHGRSLTVAQPARTRRDRTRSAIIDAALDLFRDVGYESTTMRAIATRAGVSVGNAYYYFASKEHLIQGFYDIVWDHDTPSFGLPWYQPRNGKAEVPGFFGALMENAVLTTFEPRNFLAGGDEVAVVVRYAMEVKSTGRALPEDTEIHLWTFGADGKIVRFAHVVDRHAQWAAYNGVDA